VRICSIALDSGDDNRPVADIPDIDENGNFAELTPLEARMLTRVVQFLPPPDPNNDELFVDRGAYEEQCYCLGDINETNNVDLSDLSALLSCFGGGAACPGACCPADLDCNNVVDLQDLATILAHFGDVCCASAFAGRGDGGEGADDSLTQWLRSATPEEVLEWYYAGMPW
jgi:hypothetical protein